MCIASISGIFLYCGAVAAPPIAMIPQSTPFVPPVATQRYVTSGGLMTLEEAQRILPWMQSEWMWSYELNKWVRKNNANSQR